MDNKKKRVKMTLLLDDETIKALKDYGYEHLGQTNVSKAVMFMVKNNGKNTKDIQTS